MQTVPLYPDYDDANRYPQQSKKTRDEDVELGVVRSPKRLN